MHVSNRHIILSKSEPCRRFPVIMLVHLPLMNNAIIAGITGTGIIQSETGCSICCSYRNGYACYLLTGNIFDHNL
ncbi:hypothetical protein DXN05_20605 [Deminuibacter soli]|uniref:Uncharacterized protein n=1 Tax=Deminuibacter soli TaxID=2291815 RepID=A0A3E1NEB1_9BACT|nr:hypothetical protein DXN05_20605 [Deminuibacter soli]